MSARKEITNSADVIDSRDITARIEELTSLRADAQLDESADLETMADNTELRLSVDFSEEEYRELKMLEALAEEASGSPDWIHGEGLIRDSYFKEYAQQFAEDCGMTEKSNQWPTRCIDWEQAADELKQDYMSVDFDGVEYWIRA